MRLAIIVPTVEGHTDDLFRCVDAYEQTAGNAKIYIERNHRSCGAAWIAGAERAEHDGFDYLHFTADDLEPHAGWLDIAVQTVEKSHIPAPLVFHPDGTLESAGIEGFGCYTGSHQDWQLVEGTTIPFLTREMWKQIGMIPVHYCATLYVSHAGRIYGWETAIRTGMRFTRYGTDGDGDVDRAGPDTQEFLRAIGNLQCAS